MSISSMSIYSARVGCRRRRRRRCSLYYATGVRRCMFGQVMAMTYNEYPHGDMANQHVHITIEGG